MKILWKTNYPLPSIAEKVGLPVTVNEGWLVGLSETLLSQGYDLVFCTVISEKLERIFYQTGNITFYGIPAKQDRKYDKGLREKFEEVLGAENPDIIHIMGTEFPHSFSMWEACKTLRLSDHCVVSVQGLISHIAAAYDAGIEEKYKKKRLLWDTFIKDSILVNKNDFTIRGEYEKKLLAEVKNVIGRTEWDEMCVRQMNPAVNYYKCNETLRTVFYQNKWQYEKCEKHSIMISQATYPVKGFHVLLRAVAQLKRKYTDIKVYVPSQTVFPVAMKRSRWLNSDYANYIVKLITENELGDHIIFLGSLDAESMCNAYLKSNVFVCPSTIENSSNSLGEAMLLGMPIVASYVGGLPSMMTHGVEGYFFPLHQEYTLAGYIDALFENIDKAKELSTHARERALKTHDAERNQKDLIMCYNKILE